MGKSGELHASGQTLGFTMPLAATSSRTVPRRTPRMDGWISARKRLAASFAGGLVVLAVAVWFAAWEISVLLAWCGAAVIFLGLAWGAVLKADGQRTRSIAKRQDESRALLDFM